MVSHNINKDDKKSTTMESLGLVLDKFVSASQNDDCLNILEEVKPSEICHGTQEMREAVKLKMFGPLTRISLSWIPCAALCKRFNVPEPHSK